MTYIVFQTLKHISVIQEIGSKFTCKYEILQQFQTYSQGFFISLSNSWIQLESDKKKKKNDHMY